MIFTAEKSEINTGNHGMEMTQIYVLVGCSQCGVETGNKILKITPTKN